MNIKIISVGIGLVFLLAIFPNVASEDYRYEFFVRPNHYFHGSIWLYPFENITTGEYPLVFYPNYEYIIFRGKYEDDFFSLDEFLELMEEEIMELDELIIVNFEYIRQTL